LTEVRVVGSFKLVFDEHPVVCNRVPTQNVGSEWTHGLLLSFHFEIQANGLAEQFDILLLSQPRSKSSGFICPNLSDVDPLKLSQRNLECSIGHKPQ